MKVVVNIGQNNTDDFKKFLNEVKTLNVAVSTFLVSEYKPTLEKFYLTECWQIGGLTGGSCWNDNEDCHEAVNGEKEPDFEDFDRVLEHFYPNISFLTYKRLARELIHYNNYTQNEYYGNYYNKTEKWVDLKEVFDCLNREKSEVKK